MSADRCPLCLGPSKPDAYGKPMACVWCLTGIPRDAGVSEDRLRTWTANAQQVRRFDRPYQAGVE